MPIRRTPFGADAATTVVASSAAAPAAATPAAAGATPAVRATGRHHPRSVHIVDASPA
jgi:hypothetical protein